MEHLTPQQASEALDGISASPDAITRARGALEKCRDKGIPVARITPRADGGVVVWVILNGQQIATEYGP